MTQSSHTVTNTSTQSAPDNSAEDVDADPRPLIVDVVLDEADWSTFGSVVPIVEAAADAVAACSDLKLARSDAAIALSSDAEIATLNGTYRGKSKPTNVLSFPAGDIPAGQPHSGRRFLGDIMIARETVLTEAAVQNIPPIHHLQHLVVHGLLHLLGYDHENDDDANAMEALETSILAGLGIPDPYLLA